MSRPSPAALRLQKELRILAKDPPPSVHARPNPSNILEWHYVVEGPSDSPYEGGLYHGKLLFPEEYPFKPPSVLMLTPSGRFKTNTRICLSMSDYHPESWNPLWSVSSILTGLVSFMCDSASAVGTVVASDVVKRELARRSTAHNAKSPLYTKLFPDLAQAAPRQPEQALDCLPSPAQHAAAAPARGAGLGRTEGIVAAHTEALSTRSRMALSESRPLLGATPPAAAGVREGAPRTRGMPLVFVSLTAVSLLVAALAYHFGHL